MTYHPNERLSLKMFGAYTPTYHMVFIEIHTELLSGMILLSG